MAAATIPTPCQALLAIECHELRRIPLELRSAELRSPDPTGSSPTIVEAFVIPLANAVTPYLPCSSFACSHTTRSVARPCLLKAALLPWPYYSSAPVGQRAALPCPGPLQRCLHLALRTRAHLCCTAMCAGFTRTRQATTAPPVEPCAAAAWPSWGKKGKEGMMSGPHAPD